MKNIYDYFKYYGDISFNDICFNDVDALIFSLVSYVDFEHLLDNKNNIYLSDASKLFLDYYRPEDFKKKDWLFPSSYQLMECIIKSKRYKYIKLSNFVSIVNDNGQFGACTLRSKEGKFTYISYKGTDSAIIGWKEDLEIVYKEKTYAQDMSLKYLKNNIHFFEKNIYIGGHSKGGNNSMYAYMNASNWLQNKVVKVYNFDGPGFVDDIYNTNKYQKLKEKLVTFVPYNSTVGMMLNNTNLHVVSTSNKGLLGHDAYSWEVFGSFFIVKELSKKSIQFNKDLSLFVNKMDKNERKEFIDILFNVFISHGITSVLKIREMSLKDGVLLLKDINNVSKDVKEKLAYMIKLLITMNY